MRSQCAWSNRPGAVAPRQIASLAQQGRRVRGEPCYGRGALIEDYPWFLLVKVAFQYILVLPGTTNPIYNSPARSICLAVRNAFPSGFT